MQTTAACPASAAPARLGLSWPLVVALGAFALSLASGPRMLGDSDVLWHLVAGRWIVAHGAVPRVDILSHSMAGAPWTPHEWLSEVAMAAAYDLLGWHGLVILAGGAIALALALFTRAMLALLEPVHALLAAALAWAMLMPHWLARPHALALPVLVLWTVLIVRARLRDDVPPWPSLISRFMLNTANMTGMLSTTAERIPTRMFAVVAPKSL